GAAADGSGGAAVLVVEPIFVLRRGSFGERALHSVQAVRLDHAAAKGAPQITLAVHKCLTPCLLRGRALGVDDGGEYYREVLGTEIECFSVQLEHTAVKAS
ncbi:MAG: hypothetical protein VCB26_11560, partial [Candidatus Hydrogenedentota bacterium]